MSSMHALNSSELFRTVELLRFQNETQAMTSKLITRAPKQQASRHQSKQQVKGGDCARAGTPNSGPSGGRPARLAHIPMSLSWLLCPCEPNFFKTKRSLVNRGS
jgi:hypothetical protein